MCLCLCVRARACVRALVRVSVCVRVRVRVRVSVLIEPGQAETNLAWPPNFWDCLFAVIFFVLFFNF